MPRAAGYQNPETVAEICAVLRGGGSRGSAARKVGVSVNTIDGWIERSPVFAAQVERAEWTAAERGKAPKPVREPTGDQRWERVKEEASALGHGLYGLLLWVDALLVTKGFAAMPPLWREVLRGFWTSGKRWLLLRIGRGGGKSTMLCRATVVECLFGDHSWLGPGEVAIWPLMSVDMDEANLKVGVVVAILEALGVEYEKHVRQLGRTRIMFQDIDGKDIEVRVYPATVTAASGPTLAGCTNDEEAKWKSDKDKGYNSADEVLDALGPAFRARQGTHGYRCSSAWIESGPHYEDIKAGDTANHHVAQLGDFANQVKADLLRMAETEEKEQDRASLRTYAETLAEDSPNIPTWLANPSISAEATRLEARTFDAWMREYVSRSSGGAEESFFDSRKLSDAVRAHVPRRQPDAMTAALDPASTRNAFALAIVGRWDEPNGSIYAPTLLFEWVPSEGSPLDVDRIVIPEAAKMVRDADVKLWRTDAHYLASVMLRGSEHGIGTELSGPDIYETEYRPVRDELHRGGIVLNGCEHAPELARQLGMTRERLGDNGKRRITVAEERSKGTTLHGDLGRAFVRACAMLGAGQQRAPKARITSSQSRYGRGRV